MPAKKKAEEEQGVQDSVQVQAISGVSEINLYDCGRFYAFGDVDEELALDIIQWIDRWNMVSEGFPEEEQEPLTLIINGYGGTLTECMAIVDAISSSKIPVNTLVTGKAYSADFMIAIAGHKRMATRNADLMTHSFSGGKQGTRADLKACRDHEDRNHEMMIKHHVKHSNLSAKQVEDMLLHGTDVYLTLDECLEYGFIDEIV